MEANSISLFYRTLGELQGQKSQHATIFGSKSKFCPTGESVDERAEILVGKDDKNRAHREWRG